MLILRELKAGKPSRLRQIQLAGNHITFGRSPGCTYQLANVGTVSRVQATLKKDADGWWISDGSIDQASSAGVYIGMRRLFKPIPLAPDLTIDLFKSDDYQVVLEVIDLHESDLAVSDRDTAEIPINAEIAALQKSIELLAQQVAKIGDRVDRIGDRVNQVERQQGELSDFLREAIAAEFTGKIDELAVKLMPQIQAAHDRNSEQDSVIRNSVIGLAGALIFVCSHNLSQGKSDLVDRAFSIFGLFVGGGGAVMELRREQANGSAPSLFARPLLKRRKAR
jgi:pSer/pThr/pTyr-binding forkhead associated (FHA) protein